MTEALHRLTRVDYPNPATRATEFFYGDANGGPLSEASQRHAIGRLLSRTDNSGTEDFVYGTQGEVTSVHRVLNGIGPSVGSLETTTRFAYDSFNRLQHIEYPDHEMVSYEYDSGGALRRVVGTLPNQVQREYVHDIRYDLFGHRVFQELGNHVVSRYHYDPVMQRMDSVNTDSPGQGAGAAGALQRLSYAYNPVGNITGISTTPVAGATRLANITQSFTFDDLDQLTNATGTYRFANGSRRQYSMNMGFDEIGNILSKQQTDVTVTANNVILGQSRTTYNNGYTYAAGRPHQAIDVGGRKIRYDADGNQIDLRGGGEPRRILAWDDSDQLLSVTDSGGGSGESELRVFFHPDHKGARGTFPSAVQHSTQLVTNANGQVREHLADTARGSACENPSRSPTTGIYYFGVRYYEARMSHWISVDPPLAEAHLSTPERTVDVRDGVLSSYARNRPTKLLDPSGRWTDDTSIAGLVMRLHISSQVLLGFDHE